MEIDFHQIGARLGFSESAVQAAWSALRHSGGGMAQFSHPELGGSGQWMPGMTMIGDMFNSGLQGRVSTLFSELSQHAREPSSSPARDTLSPQTSLKYSSAAPRSWYPAELGSPSSTGDQNGVRYAYFPATRRLAIQLGGDVTIYDTADHTIYGVGQAQDTSGGSLTFTSQHGTVPLSQLRVVSRD